MRGFASFLLGVLVTIGAAYIHDTMADPGTRPFVNWDVVQTSTQSGYEALRQQWDRLTNR